ncbi:MAG: hypothetical protein ABIX37_01705 [Gammaproteobacteria bacterium]
MPSVPVRVAAITVVVAVVGILAIDGIRSEELLEIAGYLAAAICVWWVARDDQDLLQEAVLAAGLIFCWVLTI